MKGSIVAILSFGFLVGNIAANGAKLRIVGGKDARIEDYPYQASLRLLGKHFCGGTIIGPRHILTAGHCLRSNNPTSLMRIHTGTTSSRAPGHSHRIRKITIHKGYDGTDESSHHHDIALIELVDAIKYDETQKPISLASRQVVGGEKADLTGWGYESNNAKNSALVLQHTITKILARKDCLRSIKNAIYKEQICAFRSKGIGACNGDSGGPLVVDGELVGVVSWVDGEYCAVGTNEVYTNVYLYKDWIKERMN